MSSSNNNNNNTRTSSSSSSSGNQILDPATMVLESDSSDVEEEQQEEEEELSPQQQQQQQLSGAPPPPESGRSLDTTGSAYVPHTMNDEFLLHQQEKVDLYNNASSSSSTTTPAASAADVIVTVEVSEEHQGTDNTGQNEQQRQQQVVKEGKGKNLISARRTTSNPNNKNSKGGDAICTSTDDGEEVIMAAGLEQQPPPQQQQHGAFSVIGDTAIPAGSSSAASTSLAAMMMTRGGVDDVVLSLAHEEEEETSTIMTSQRQTVLANDFHTTMIDQDNDHDENLLLEAELVPEQPPIVFASPMVETIPIVTPMMAATAASNQPTEGAAAARSQFYDIEQVDMDASMMMTMRNTSITGGGDGSRRNNDEEESKGIWTKFFAQRRRRLLVGLALLLLVLGLMGGILGAVVLLGQSSSSSSSDKGASQNKLLGINEACSDSIDCENSACGYNAFSLPAEQICCPSGVTRTLVLSRMNDNNGDALNDNDGDDDGGVLVTYCALHFPVGATCPSAEDDDDKNDSASASSAGTDIDLCTEDATCQNGLCVVKSRPPSPAPTILELSGRPTVAPAPTAVGEPCTSANECVNTCSWDYQYMDHGTVCCPPGREDVTFSYDGEETTFCSFLDLKEGATCENYYDCFSRSCDVVNQICQGGRREPSNNDDVVPSTSPMAPSSLAPGEPCTSEDECIGSFTSCALNFQDTENGLVCCPKGKGHVTFEWNGVVTDFCKNTIPPGDACPFEIVESYLLCETFLCTNDGFCAGGETTVVDHNNTAVPSACEFDTDCSSDGSILCATNGWSFTSSLACCEDTVQYLGFPFCEGTIPNGDSCPSTEEGNQMCSSGICASDGVCVTTTDSQEPALLASGVSCNASSECASSACAMDFRSVGDDDASSAPTPVCCPMGTSSVLEMTWEGTSMTFCRNTIPLDGPCPSEVLEADFLCDTFICIGGSCKYEYQDDGDSCENDYDCLNLACANGQWPLDTESPLIICCSEGQRVEYLGVEYCIGSLSGGASCPADTDEGNLLCVSGTCGSDGVCSDTIGEEGGGEVTGAAPGESCSSSTDCATSANCAIDFLDIEGGRVCCPPEAGVVDMEWEGVPRLFCKNTIPLDEPCPSQISDADFLCETFICIGGYCEHEYHKDGDTCEFDFDCNSLTCANGEWPLNAALPLICCAEADRVEYLGVEYCTGRFPGGASCPTGTAEGSQMCASGSCSLDGICSDPLPSESGSSGPGEGTTPGDLLTGGSCSDSTECPDRQGCATDFRNIPGGRVCCPNEGVVDIEWQGVPTLFCKNTIPLDEPCPSQIFEADLLCDTFICIGGYCEFERHVEGDFCENDWDCNSFTCALDDWASTNPSLICCATRVEYLGVSYCTGRIPPGGACPAGTDEGDAMCASGTCEADGTCASTDR